MSNSKRTFASRRRLNTTLKFAALIAALGLVTAMLEQPRLTAAPTRPVEQSLYQAGAAGTPAPRSMSEPASPGASPLPASEYGPAYFPRLFAPPVGEVEAQPPSF